MNYNEKTLAAKRVMLERDFKTFMRWNFKRATGQSFILGEHHSLLAQAIQDVLDLKTHKLLITIPPRYSKTEVIKQFCAAGFARNPSSNFIYTSYSHRLALKSSGEIKALITHDKYQELWPIKIKYETRAKELWETEDDGGVYATSFGGPITGFGAGKLDGYKSKTAYEFNGALIIDDPIKTQDRHRKIARQEAIDYYTGTLTSRFNSTKTPCIMIMQRLHPEDLAGYVLAEEEDDWVVLNLPAIKENGDALWPAKHNIEELNKLAKNNEMFSSQYMQQPIKLGGNIIKPALFKNYGELPFLRKRFITVDTATKEKEVNDYSVFQAWGIGHDNYLYLIDLFRKKLKYGDLKTRFIAFWNKHNCMYDNKQYGYLSCAYVEDKSSGTQLIQEAQAEGKIPVVPIQRNRSKIERVVDILLPKMASGFIQVPLDAPWLADFYSECEDFHPDMSHKYDDQIDPMIDAVEIGSQSVNTDDGGILNSNIEKKSRVLSRQRKRRR